MGGGIELIRALNDLGLESEIPDFIARSESAKNDLFSKFRLHSLYDSSHICCTMLPFVSFIDTRKS